MGELGTTTEALEHGLRDILEVASAWNAVILIDEADVFLEQRRDSDIQRNAMVGVFLRLLEYHQVFAYYIHMRAFICAHAQARKLMHKHTHASSDSPYKHKHTQKVRDRCGQYIRQKV